LPQNSFSARVNQADLASALDVMRE